MRTQKLLVCAVSALLIFFAAGCGTPGAPQPPSLHLPRPADDLSATRKGNHVLLTWTPVTETTDRQANRYPGVTRICRAVAQFPMNACDAVAELTPQQIRQRTSQASHVVMYEDTLPATVQQKSPLDFATYAVEALNSRGRSAGLSNQVRVPLAPTLPPPADVRAQVTSDGVQLSWPAAAISPVEGLSYMYRVSRRASAAGNFASIGEFPLDPAMKVSDQTFDWEQNYEYKVTPITIVTHNGAVLAQVEGEDSPVVKVFAHDLFPPAAPTGVQAVFSGTGQKSFIDLTWAPNTESDLAGYTVYRRDDNGQVTKITTQLLKAPSFRDENVAAGHTYSYSVTASDLRGNESQHSAETSEAVPKN